MGSDAGELEQYSSSQTNLNVLEMLGSSTTIIAVFEYEEMMKNADTELPPDQFQTVV
jgi:hypothetical protein